MDDKNTSQMQDEVPVEQSATTADTLINESTEEQSSDLSSSEEVDSSSEDLSTDSNADNEEEEEKPAQAPSPRENRRIAELTRKLAEANQRQTYPQQMQQASAPIIQEGDYDIDQINTVAQQYGEKRYNDGVKLANTLAFSTRLEVDAPKVEAKYPVLNPRDQNFDPGIADWTTQMYYKAVGLKTTGDGSFEVENPNIRYEEYIEGLMEAVDVLASAKAVDTKTNIIKQAAQTGVRPGGIAKKQYNGTDPKKMTTEQLKAAINASLGI